MLTNAKEVAYQITNKWTFFGNREINKLINGNCITSYFLKKSKEFMTYKGNIFNWYSYLTNNVFIHN